MQPKFINFFIGSDFHLEVVCGDRFFNPIDFIPTIQTNKSEFNVCLLAGDICRPVRVSRPSKYLEEFCSHFDLVFYVEGNHEHWSGNYGRNFDKLRDACGNIGNLHFLRRERFDFSVSGKDFSVVGATLWSDLSSVSRIDLDYVSLARNGYGKAVICDFSNIRFPVARGYRRMRPYNYQQLHDADAKFIREQFKELQSSNRFKVLLSHHSPTLKSLTEYDQYGVFDATNLEDVMIEGGYDLVAHGHIHRKDFFREKIGSSLVVSNPADYTTLARNAKSYVMSSSLRLAL